VFALGVALLTLLLTTPLAVAQDAGDSGTGRPTDAERSGRPEQRESARTDFPELQNRLAAEDLSEAERLELMKTAADRAPTVSAALDVLSTHLDRLSGPRRAAAVAAAAELHALRGDLESAADSYAEAAGIAAIGEAAAARYRLEEATIRLEMGEVDSASRLAEGVVGDSRDPRIQRRAALLQARARSAAGDTEAAFDLTRTLSEAEHAPTLKPATLLFLYRLARRLERAGEAERARRLLSELYPDSPEMMLVSGGSEVSGFPGPSAFLGADALTPPADATDSAEAGSAVANATGAASAADGAGSGGEPRGVQVGSFKSMENARDMRREMSSAGFTAEIVDAPGSEFHRVIIAVPEGSDPQRLLIRLKEEGFEGFLVFDE
jgi:cell division septation protein DedD